MSTNTVEYHEAAIDYNEKMAETAEGLVDTVEHDVIKRWCTSIGKQHRYHANLHRRALNRLKAKLAKDKDAGSPSEAESTEEQLPFSAEIKLDADVSKDEPEPAKVEVTDQAANA